LFGLFPQSDNVLFEQVRNVLLRGYTSSQKIREDYGRRGHYQDERAGVEKAPGGAEGFGQSDNPEGGSGAVASQ
jgi:hypothetical protein